MTDYLKDILDNHIWRTTVYAPPTKPPRLVLIDCGEKIVAESGQDLMVVQKVSKRGKLKRIFLRSFDDFYVIVSRDGCYRFAIADEWKNVLFLFKKLEVKAGDRLIFKKGKIKFSDDSLWIF